MCTEKAQSGMNVSILKHIQGVDIDAQGKSGGNFPEEEVDLPEEGPQGGALCGFEQELKTMLAAQAGKGAGGRTENLYGRARLPQGLSEFFCPLGDEFTVIAGQDEIDQVPEGRVTEFLPESDLLGIEGVKVVIEGAGDSIVLGRVGLNQHPPRQITAAGPSRHLGEEGEGPFGGTEVGKIESEIGIDDADEGDAGEIVSFGNHLRADEDVDLSRQHRFDNLAMCALVAGGVAIHAADTRLGKGRPQLFFEAFCPGADRFQIDAVAGRAERRDR